MTTPLNRLSASEAAAAIAAGRFTSEELVGACLERIAEREPVVGAWAHIDPDYALSQARERDRAGGGGPLHGVPVAVKDIFDTCDMPTAMGSPIYADNRPAGDASAVSIVRAAGAVVLGKTVTTEFAGAHPGKTANPHDPAHTPGGSSSGSAAAVADAMAPVGFGTQTAGSVIRPAAFCGVIGYKPSFGAFNRAGLKPLAESLDTIGLIARTLDDIALVAAVLTGRTARPPAARARPPRIALCRTHLWRHAGEATSRAVEDAAARAAAAGAAVDELDFPAEFAALTDHHWTVLSFETARALHFEWRRHRDRLSERLRGIIERGLETPFDDYAAALGQGASARARVPEILAHFDVVLTASTAGEAPEGLGSTGDFRFQSLWTLLHLPCLTLPTHVGPGGLPVGVQLVGVHGGDAALLAAARWVADALGPARAV